MRSISSHLFWRVILVLFLFESLWIAFSARYPMAFDEQYHFGLIQLHAKQWLPFFTSQPPTGAYGAVVRDPSYLYHWLVSFPYRLISLFTHNRTTQVIWLRLINIALFVYALTLYRRLLKRFKLSEAFINCSFLALILIPIVPFLAATINYDNLLLVAVPLSVLLTLDVFDTFQAHRIPLARITALVSLLFLGSLIKYPFLPVLVIIIVFLLWCLWRYKLATKAIWHKAWTEFASLAKYRQLLLMLLLVVSLGLFCERYAVNLVRYHTPVPTCDHVVSTDMCLQYEPWGRDYDLAQNKSTVFHPNLIAYTADWFDGMWYRLFFAVGPYPTYDTHAALPIISVLAIALAALALIGILMRAALLFRGHPERVLLLLLILAYGISLFADNYMDYIHTAEPVAINGRYWIPFLPLLFVLAGIAWSSILRRSATAKLTVSSIILAAFLLQGGGTMTFIVQSNDNWLWPNSTVQRVNKDVRSTVSPLMWR